MTRIVSVAHWPADRRVLTNVSLSPRRPLISPWVYTHAGFAAFVLFMADLIAGRL